MLLTDMGSHISLKTLKEFWPLVAFPVVMLTINYFIGRLTVRFFNQPNYIVPGMVFNNVVAMPLLLLEAISNSDVLLPLLRENETIEKALVRARAYVLLHGIVHNIARFALGPLMLRQQAIKKSHPSDVERFGGVVVTEPAPTERTALLIDSEQISPDHDEFLRKRARLLSTSSIDLDETDALLRGYKDFSSQEILHDGSTRYSRRGTLTALFLTSSPSTTSVPEAARHRKSVTDAGDPLFISESTSSSPVSSLPADIEVQREPTKWRSVLNAVEQFLNPAVCAALLAVFIGVTPPLHYIFYDNVAITSSFTQSIKSIGSLYPALQLFALGGKLAAPLRHPVRISTTVLIAIVRFGLAGLLSVSIVSYMSSHCSPSFWPMDPMLNFVLMITPVGPPAITLAAVAEIAGVSPDEVTAVSRTLLYSYIIAPLVAPSVAIALSVAYQIKA